MKQKIFKILFILSIVFYIALLGIAIAAGITGTTFIFSKIYGFDAFIITLVALGYALCVEIPILPVVVIFDIVYILRKTVLKNLDTKKFLKRVIVPLIIATLIGCIALTWDNLSYYAEKQIQKAEFSKMLKYKDEEVVYDDSDIYVDGIMGHKEYTRSTIFMDYDKNTIGILSTHSFGDYHEFKLIKSSAEDLQQLKNKYYLQAEIKLNGGTLLAFCTSNDNTHRTIAFAFENKDGTIYLKDNIESKHYGLVTFLSSYQYSDAAQKSK